ncbi:MAG TPA: hypothetical protein VHL79_22615 [Ramlibacter sp.]|nr:hypothetical protein [Ramlibacter sp.]
MKHALKLLSLPAAVLIGLAGCATTPTPSGMTVTEVVQVNPKLRGAVALTSVTTTKDVAGLDGNGFRKALEDTLSRVGYLAPNASAAPYKVTAELRQLEHPLGSADLNVTSEVQYTVRGPSGPAQDLPVMAVGSAKTTDGFGAGQRMRVASERAIQENIKVFLNQLSGIE